MSRKTSTGANWEVCVRIAAGKHGDECVMWPGNPAVQLKHGLYRLRPPEAVCMLAHGHGKPGQRVIRCDVSRRCCNPKHLRWASKEEEKLFLREKDVKLAMALAYFKIDFTTIAEHVHCTEVDIDRAIERGHSLTRDSAIYAIARHLRDFDSCVCISRNDAKYCGNDWAMCTFRFVGAFSRRLRYNEAVVQRCEKSDRCINPGHMSVVKRKPDGTPGGRSKFTKDDILTIRLLAKYYSNVQLSMHYKVAVRTIQRVITGRRYPPSEDFGHFDLQFWRSVVAWEDSQCQK